VLDPAEVFDRSVADHLTVVEAIIQSRSVLERIALNMSNALLAGKKILWCGNGGSAADSQHLAAELVGRFLMERRALPSIALSVNTSVLTAIGNDYGFEHVFERQIEALCVSGDVVVGISTSGNSTNVCLALEKAREIGAFTVAFTGGKGGRIMGIAHETLGIPSSETPRIQEGHILCGHMICDYIERHLFLAGSMETKVAKPMMAAE
jgi:D-sedoheptulose 7-phosphate isomerase